LVLDGAWSPKHKALPKCKSSLKQAAGVRSWLIDGGNAIIIVYLLVSVGVIGTFVLILGGGLERLAE
jgi:hypothetical protein